MSCEITSGITTGCNDQVGGIVGIHYFTWSSDLVVEKDANGVIIRIYRASNPTANIPWYFIQADNGMGSVTETYNVGGTGSILGFHQSASFFIPETATPSADDPTQNLNEFVEVLAAQNNLVIGIETQDNSPLLGPSQKCFVFGLERPAYCASGSRESGITYTDNNGYNLELAADSKAPMEEIAYMAMHSQNLRSNVIGSGGVTFWNSSTAFNLEPLIEFEGGNISSGFPGGPVIYMNVMPGELLSVEVQVTMDWLPDAFSGTTFLPEWQIGDGLLIAPMSYTNTTQYPIPTAPGVAKIQLKGNLTNTFSTVREVIPVRMPIPTVPGVPNVNNMAYTPECKFLTITRST